MATFRGSQTSTPKPRILFYGHYDVISARSTGWVSDPFTLSGRNGYLYGRGATDNKGPVMAVACAAAELLAHRALSVDLVLLVEGEEEAGSGGFVETVKRHKVQEHLFLAGRRGSNRPLQETIGQIDSILVRYHSFFDSQERIHTQHPAATPPGSRRTPRVSHTACEAWCIAMWRFVCKSFPAKFFELIALKIFNAGPDLHSGVDGGAAREPMLDM